MSHPLPARLIATIFRATDTTQATFSRLTTPSAKPSLRSTAQTAKRSISGSKASRTGASTTSGELAGAQAVNVIAQHAHVVVHLTD